MSGSFWNSKKVLVAGGAGAIGSHLVELLVDEGASVSVADNLSRGRLENLSRVLDRISFSKVDLRYLDACESVCEGKDVVMDLAAPVFGVEYSICHNGEMLTDVILTGFNVLEAARRKNVKRFLVVSSSCVYPDDAIVPTPEREALRGSPDSSNLGYGWGKRMVELQGQFYAGEYGMEVAIGRPFNGYGAREPLEDVKAHVIPALTRKVLDGNDPVVVWGSGNQTRSFVHYRDLAMGLKLVTENYAVADPVNVGHDRETTIRELIERILALTHRCPRLVFDTTKPEGPVRKSADVTKLGTIMGAYNFQTTLETGLSEMIEYMRRTSDCTAR
jgi:nucleoside-diphosphate-sugar epimerase